jgi:hypothetical protein
MLMTEWNWDDAKQIWQEEAREEEREEFARKMKARGRPLVEIIEDTGLDVETIEKL